MQKILKLTGVSMLAVMVAANANAAGYTCEELIEYTSCNPGYYLQNQSCAGDNDEIMSDVCECDGEYHGAVSSKEECNIDEHCAGYGYATFYETACVSDGEWVAPLSGTVTCNECPAGSTCAGNTAGATPCPAGSYCATAGLSQPTGKCNVGTYSTGGATACTTCPVSGLTDAWGDVVSVTTESTGSTSSSECFVAKGTLFEDAKGIYKYTDNCKHGNYGSKVEILDDGMYSELLGRCYDLDAELVDHEDGFLSCDDPYGQYPAACDNGGGYNVDTGEFDCTLYIFAQE